MRVSGSWARPLTANRARQRSHVYAWLGEDECATMSEACGRWTPGSNARTSYSVDRHRPRPEPMHSGRWRSRTCSSAMRVNLPQEHDIPRADNEGGGA